MSQRGHRGRLRLVADALEANASGGSAGEADGIAPPGTAAPGATPAIEASHVLVHESRETSPISAARPQLGSDPGWAEQAPVTRGDPALPVSRRDSAAALGVLPDAQLVALAANGDTQAFEILYRRHVAFAIHLATRIEGAARDVEDIVHDAFLRAFERLGDLTDRAAFRGWLGAIVVHRVRSRMRRTRLMSVLGMGRASEPVDLDAIASPDASPHVRAQIAQIYALLRTLPTDDRIAWTLRAVEGHDLETVARLTECSLATVKRRIARAQKFLDEHFVDPQKSVTRGDPEPPAESSKESVS